MWWQGHVLNAKPCEEWHPNWCHPSLLLSEWNTWLLYWNYPTINFWSQQNSLITLWVSFICRTCLSRQRTSPGCWQLWYCTWEECLPYLSLLWDFKWPNRVETRGTIIFQLNFFRKNEIFSLYLNSKFVIFNHCECSSQKLCCKLVAGFSMGHCQQFFIEMSHIDWAFY